MSNSILRLKQRLLYSFRFDYDEVRAIESDYIDSGIAQDVDSFYQDTVNNDDASILKRGRLLFNYLSVPILQLVLAFVFAFSENLSFLYIALGAYILTDIINALDFRAANKVLKLRSKTGLWAFAVGLLILVFALFLESKHIVLFIAPERVGSLLSILIPVLILGLSIIKFVLLYFRYNTNVFAFSQLLTPTILELALARMLMTFVGKPEDFNRLYLIVMVVTLACYLIIMGLILALQNKLKGK